MTNARESWKEIGSKLEALGLKLKYHFEQERADDEPDPDDRAIQRLGRAIDEVADSVEHAVKDEAVKGDLKDIFRALPGALTQTFQQVSGDVRRALDKRPDSTLEAAPPPEEEPNSD
ncbi:MAG: hypothetical protein OEM97_05330 [Acidimicrobiia bacterium]|nr:hypothetical protein [Acidimicrobiia bacterium]